MNSFDKTILKKIIENVLREDETNNFENPSVSGQEEPKDKDIDKQSVVLTSADERLLDNLETSIEVAINKSVDTDNSMQENTNNNLTEEASLGGFAYEDRVISALRKSKANGNIKKAAGAASVYSDADININGEIYNIEVKLNKDAQMGGSSVRYSTTGEIILVNQAIEKDSQDLLIDIVKQQSKKINKLIRFLITHPPKEINARNKSFPLSVTKKAWEQAQKKGLLITLRKIPSSIEFLTNHYAKKNVFYIQVGGLGLFYLSANPANLPVPKLEGTMFTELRTARGGSKTLSNGMQVCGAGLRIQGRLQTKNIKSPYTLDDPKSIISLLDYMKNQKLN